MTAAGRSGVTAGIRNVVVESLAWGGVPHVIALAKEFLLFDDDDEEQTVWVPKRDVQREDAFCVLRDEPGLPTLTDCSAELCVRRVCVCVCVDPVVDGRGSSRFAPGNRRILDPDLNP